MISLFYYLYILENHYPYLVGIFLLFVLSSLLIYLASGFNRSLLANQSALSRHAVWVVLNLILIVVGSVSLFQILQKKDPWPTAIAQVLDGDYLNYADHTLRSNGLLITSDQLRLGTEEANLDDKRPMPPWRQTNVSWSSIDQTLGPWRQIDLIALPIWFVGALIVVLKHLFQLIIVRKRLKSSVEDPPEEIQRLFDQLVARLGIRRRPKLLIVRGFYVPFLLGAVFPAVYFPKSLLRLSEEKLRYIFIHELSHHKRGDAAWSILIKINQALFWWNPFNFLVERAFVQESEIASDDSVLSLGGDAKIYADQLVALARNVAGSKSVPGALSIVQNHPLKRRIRFIVRPEVSRNVLGLRFILPLVILSLLGALALAGYMQTGNQKHLRAQVIVPSSNELVNELSAFIDAARERQEFMRFVHFDLSMEQRFRARGETVWTTIAENSQAEIWADLWSGAFRIQHQPRVGPWYGGTKPYFAEYETNIFDGQLYYVGNGVGADVGFGSGKPLKNYQLFEVYNYLGIAEEIDAIRIAQMLLDNDAGEYQMDYPSFRFHFSASIHEQNGARYLKIVEEQYIGKEGDRTLSSSQIIEIDPIQGYLVALVFNHYPSSGSLPRTYRLLKSSEWQSEFWYPTHYLRSYQSREEWNQFYTIEGFEVLPDLPAGITVSPVNVLN